MKKAPPAWRSAEVGSYLSCSTNGVHCDEQSRPDGYGDSSALPVHLWCLPALGTHSGHAGTEDADGVIFRKEFEGVALQWAHLDHGFKVSA